MDFYIQPNQWYIQVPWSSTDPMSIKEFYKRAALLDSIVLTEQDRKDIKYVELQKKLNKNMLEIVNAVRVFVETIPDCAYTIQLDHGTNGFLRKVSIHFDAQYSPSTYSAMKTFVWKYGYVTKRSGRGMSKKDKSLVYNRCQALKEYYWDDLTK